MIEYQLVRSRRKTLAIQIDKDGQVIVRAPLACSRQVIETFLKEKQGWILKKSGELKSRAQERLMEPSFSDEERRELAQKAGEVLARRTSYFAKKMGVTYGRITIRDQKTRWGSCSGRGNLNFNWRLILMPENVLDYVVVHELAHRREMNHSSRFYQVVESVIPEYRESMEWLRKNGSRYIKR